MLGLKPFGCAFSVVCYATGGVAFRFKRLLTPTEEELKEEKEGVIANQFDEHWVADLKRFFIHKWYDMDDRCPSCMTPGNKAGIDSAYIDRKLDSFIAYAARVLVNNNGIPKE